LINKERIIKGDSLVFNSGLIIKQFTVDEVLEIGFSNYINFVNLFVLKPQDIIIPLWGQGVYYEDITHDELFIMQLKQNKDYYFELFKLFTNCDKVWIDYIEELESETICYQINDKSFYLGFQGFDLIYTYFKKTILHEHARKRFFTGEKTKKTILDEDFEEYQEEMKSNKDSDSFSDMITFLVISNKRKWEDVYSYPMSRFYEEYIKTYRKHEADYTLFGIYSGNIDPKKIQTKKLQWFKS